MTRTIRTAALIVALVAAFLVGLLVPAPREPYAAAATNTLHYAEGASGVRQIGTWPQRTITVDTTHLNRRWNARKVAAKIERRTGLHLVVGTCPPIRYTAAGDPIYTDACVTVASDRHLFPTRQRARVALWSEGTTLQAAAVELDDTNTRRWSKVKRERMLCAYLGRGAGLTKAETKAACR